MNRILGKDRNICVLIFVIAVIFFAANIEIGTQLFSYFINVASGFWEPGDYYHFVYGNFDNYMIFGSGLATIFCPILSIFSGYLFYKKESTVNKFVYYRTSSRIATYLKNAAAISLKVVAGIYAAFLVYYLFGVIICDINTLEELINPWRLMFTDILGLEFYVEHRYLFYFIEGTIKFFVMPLGFSMLFCSSLLICKKISITIIFVLFLLFGLFEFSQMVLRGRVPLGIVTIFNPFAFYGSSDYTVASWWYFISLAMPYLYSLIIIYSNRNYEI